MGVLAEGLTFDIGINSSKYTSGIKSMKSANASLESGLKKLGGVIAGVFGGVTITTIMSKSLKVWGAQEDATLKLTIAANRFTKDSRGTVLSIKDLASKLQKMTGIGNEAYESVAALGLNMGIAENKISKATKASAVLSQIFDMDLNSAMKNLAKTQAGMTGELGESLPFLRDLTEEQLRNGEAIDLIIDKYGDYTDLLSNRNMVGTKRFWAALGDIGEVLGKKIAPAISKAADLMESFSQRVFDSGSILGAVKDIFRDFYNGLGWIGKAVIWLGGAFITLKAAGTAWALLSKVVSGGGRLIVGVFKSLFSWPTLIIAGVYLFRVAWEKDWGGIQEKTKAVWNILSPIFSTMWSWITKGWEWTIDLAGKAWDWIKEDGWPWLKEAATTTWSWLVSGLDWIYDNILEPMGRGIWEGLENAWNWTVTGLGWLYDNILEPLGRGIWEGLKTGWEWAITGLTWLWDNVLKPVSENLWEGLETGWKWAVEGLSWLYDEILKPLGQDIWDGLKTAWDWTIGFLGTAWEWLKDTAWPWLEDTASTAWNWTAKLAGTVWGWLKDTAWSWLKDSAETAWDWTANLAGTVWNWLKDTAWKWLTDAASTTWNWGAELTGNTWDWLKNTAWVWINDTVETTWEWVVKGYEKAKDIATSIWNGVKEGWNSIADFAGMIWDTLVQNSIAIFELGKSIGNWIWDGLKYVFGFGWLKDLLNLGGEEAALKQSHGGLVGEGSRDSGGGGGAAFASGGFVSGPGGPTSDSIPAWLSNGEFVINAAATRKWLPLLKAMNENRFTNGGVIGYRDGGKVDSYDPILGISSVSTATKTFTDYMNDIVEVMGSDFAWLIDMLGGLVERLVPGFDSATSSMDDLMAKMSGLENSYEDLDDMVEQTTTTLSGFLNELAKQSELFSIDKEGNFKQSELSESFGQAFNEMAPKISSKAGDIFGSISDKVKPALEGFKNSLGSAAGFLGKFGIQLALSVMNIDVINKLLNPFQVIIDGIVQMIEPMLNSLWPLVDLLTSFGQIIGSILNIFQPVFIIIGKAASVVGWFADQLILGIDWIFRALDKIPVIGAFVNPILSEDQRQKKQRSIQDRWNEIDNMTTPTQSTTGTSFSAGSSQNISNTFIFEFRENQILTEDDESVNRLSDMIYQNLMDRHPELVTG